MRISEAQALPGYQLQLRYASGECGVVNLSAFVGRGVFKAWENEAVFNSVRVTDEGAVEWPGEIDLCPDALYLQMTGKSADEVFPVLKQSAHA